MKAVFYVLVCSILTTSAATAQVRVRDAENIRLASQIGELSRQIQADTSLVKDHTHRTLQAVTGERGQDAALFAKLATGQGFSMAGAPDLAAILQANQAAFGGIGAPFQNSAAKLINGLNLVKSLADQFGNGATASSRNYDQAVRSLTTMAALTDAMNAAARQRSEGFDDAARHVGAAGDLKGALEQNTQMVLQGNQTTNEAVGSLNSQVHLLSEQQRAGIAAMSERNRALAPIAVSDARGSAYGDIRARLQALQQEKRSRP
ncbi:hypothetical protein EV217_5325 [Phyllobacterium myrsinacearum]|uniref:conjugal transfer protein n=1 Tax=Phyllobacterium myrsinacearum TaxID=28101 RepID=UPI0010290D61|nr:conjugal transfer protein [Phyllobacterium myrsinacearum]RZS70623.1 hypothetical protein EV217_5325 [Phyllobacterium myrsinacearum]